MTQLRVTALGATVTIRAESASARALMPQVERLWSWCPYAPALGPVDAGTVDVPEHREDAVDETLQRLTQAVTQALIAARAGQLFLFHAAAICHPRTGATLIAIARGGTGKTTLACHFGRRYGYVTDETAGLLDDGRVVPYSKPLSLRIEQGRPKQETCPDDLGLLLPHPEPRLAAVILLDRQPDAPGFDVLELADLTAIAEMAPESSSLAAMTSPLRRIRALLAPLEPVMRVTYSEVAQLDGLVDELVGTP